MKILKQQTHDPVLLVLIIKSVDVGKTVGMFGRILKSVGHIYRI